MRFAFLLLSALAVKQAPPSFDSTDSGELDGSNTTGSTSTDVVEQLPPAEPIDSLEDLH